MFINEFTKTQKLAISGLSMALYVLIMLYTQSFAFGQFQIRIATAMYGLSALFPFLLIPLGVANFLSNMLMGGLGVVDMIGGAIVGFSTCAAVIWGKKRGMHNFWITLCITLIPGLGVPLWLSYLLRVPYFLLAASVLVGQFVCGMVGAIVVTALEKNDSLVAVWGRK